MHAAFQTCISVGKVRRTSPDQRSDEGPRFADERQVRIAELVATRGRARIGELASLFGVTEPTIRKDLSALQEQGLLKRTHGGALALGAIVERGFANREATNRPAKQAIARACVALLEGGDSLFLDGGTTVDAIAQVLADPATGAGRMRLSVLTSSLGVATRMAEVPGLDAVLLGGQVRPTEGTVVGALAVENLQRFTFSIAFLGVSGFSEPGISVGSLAEAAIKSAVAERARRVVLPMDHTKVGATDFARVCELDEVDVVVMDTSTPAVEELCSAYDIELIVASG